MREEIDKILRDALGWNCKHSPCPEEQGCTECGADQLLSLFAEKVRGIEVDTKRKHGFTLSCDYDIGEERGIQNGITAFRDSLLKELEG